MAEILEFKTKSKIKNLYIVDDFHVILAYSPDEAVEFVKEHENHDEELSVRLLDDQKDINVIKSGRVEINLYERDPVGVEQLRFKLMVREFIDDYLKGFPVPSGQDYLEDRGASRPKK